ncbi:MAG: hypothetical protein QM473_08555 [Acidobacteriota bacterium]|jgi:hypothetical protein|nr:hypothetical protein [Acidobacteriota bacterium]
MKLSLAGLKNPVLAVPGVSVRDPAAIWHEGVCYLYYTRHIGDWGGSAAWDIGLVTTTDFRKFSAERIITPKGYASPGNVIRFEDRWVLVVQSYPWPSEIALMESEDLVNWSAPRHIIPADTGPGWGAEHGPIDGWLFFHDGLWYCPWVNFLKGTDHRAFGAHASCDLERWENLTPETPFIDGSAYNHNGGIENCAVVNDGERWHFFVSVGMAPQKLARVVAPVPFLWPAVTPEDELRLPPAPWCSYNQSALFVDDWREICGKWAMIFHGLDRPDGLATFGLAFSDDLREWEMP